MKLLYQIVQLLRYRRAHIEIKPTHPDVIEVILTRDKLEKAVGHLAPNLWKT